jgi:hypothetical protein
LSPEDVSEIRNLDALRQVRGSGNVGAGDFVRDMCDRFGVSRTTIRRVIADQSWSNVE